MCSQSYAESWLELDLSKRWKPKKRWPRGWSIWSASARTLVAPMGHAGALMPRSWPSCHQFAMCWDDGWGAADGTTQTIRIFHVCVISQSLAWDTCNPGTECNKPAHPMAAALAARQRGRGAWMFHARSTPLAAVLGRNIASKMKGLFVGAAQAIWAR